LVFIFAAVPYLARFPRGGSGRRLMITTGRRNMFSKIAVALVPGREPLFENAEVKVWKSLVLPNNPLPLHRHEHPRVIVALNGGTMKVLEESGSSETHQWETGKAYWLPANPPGTRHQDVNMGDKPIEVVVVELQKAN
jgi:quercetin dioxygenase-like cupin family protein